MDVAHERGWARWGRLFLLAIFVGVAWAALSLFISLSSASAAEEPRGSGLLGVVGETVDAAGSLLSETTDTVDQVVSSVTTVAAPVVEPVVEPLPAPVAQPVAAVVDTVTHTADQTVAQVDQAATAVVDTATSAVTEVAQAEVVTQVVEPVVDVAESLPVAGAVVEGLGVGDALTGVAGTVDETVATVVGSAPPTQQILPELPLTGVDEVVDIVEGAGGSIPTLPSLPSVLHPVLPPVSPVAVFPASDPGIAAAGGTARGTAPSATRAHGGTDAPTQVSAALSGPQAGISGADETPASGRHAPFGSVPTGSPAGASTSGTGAATTGLAYEDRHGAVYGFSFLRSTTDDALPGAPVFDTDVSPD